MVNVSTLFINEGRENIGERPVGSRRMKVHPNQAQDLILKATPVQLAFYDKEGESMDHFHSKAREAVGVRSTTSIESANTMSMYQITLVLLSIISTLCVFGS